MLKESNLFWLLETNLILSNKWNIKYILCTVYKNKGDVMIDYTMLRIARSIRDEWKEIAKDKHMSMIGLIRYCIKQLKAGKI